MEGHGRPWKAVEGQHLLGRHGELVGDPELRVGSMVGKRRLELGCVALLGAGEGEGEGEGEGLGALIPPTPPMDVLSIRLRVNGYKLFWTP